MSFGDLIKDVTGLLSEVNKWDKNLQSEKFLKELRSINRKLLKQEKIAKRSLILGIVVSSIASGVFGYILSKFL